MTLYLITFNHDKPLHMRASKMDALHGVLVAIRDGEVVASWAPGVWESFRPADECPTCSKPIEA